jgi:alpha-mannosidase
MTRKRLFSAKLYHAFGFAAALLLLAAALWLPAGAAPGDKAQPDLSKEKILYCVGYAHLDTEWRWTYKDTIDTYIPATMHDNFALFEKYPDYIFNFSGANRYRMMKEYYPADYEKVKQSVAAGRWFPCGSSMEESDVNVPSPESLIRQVMLGTHYFQKEFGTRSAEYMLPDCFGFPASLPAILPTAASRASPPRSSPGTPPWAFPLTSASGTASAASASWPPSTPAPTSARSKPT